MSISYSARFTAALDAALPSADFIIADRDGFVTVHHPECGSGVLVHWLPDTDRRRPVSDADVKNWLSVAESKLRGNLMHYTSRGRVDAQALLAALHPHPVRITDAEGTPFDVLADGKLGEVATFAISTALSAGFRGGLVRGITWAAYPAVPDVSRVIADIRAAQGGAGA